VYHLYRYVQPLMGQQLRRSVLFYTGLSTALAVAGLCFAYFVSLPSALHFLTGMNLANIQAMLTVDSYLTFVTTYLLGAALLFQVPLLLLVINTITPLKPSKLMKVQRYVIVVAFLIAAIISPTPDVVNQALLAIPIIVMYEIGVIFVWLQNRARARKEQPTPELLRPLPVPAAPLAQPPISADRPHVRRRTSMDVFTSRAALRGPASLGKHNNAEQATP
jgi:sec-independent protein translocase protein TatC